jgi:hypothetical protein
MSEQNISAPLKPDEAKPDPFRPAQPHIPGVKIPATQEEKGGRHGNDAPSHGLLGAAIKARLADPAKLKLFLVGVALACALATGALLFSHARGRNPSAGGERGATRAENMPTDASQLQQVAPEAPSLGGKVPMGPGAIATTSEVAKPWSAKHFYFRDPVTLKPVPALLVRLPGGALWAFSLREPYGSCELEYVTNLKQLHDEYGFTGAYPMVGDPCNRTLFDLTEYGNGPGGLVRGEVAQGSGWRPPMAIELRIKGNEIIAARMEE